MATDTVLHHDTPVITAQGLFHELEIFPDRLVIHRTDLLSRFFSSDEIILFGDIEGLHVYRPSVAIGSEVQLIINTKTGKPRRLSYSAHQNHLPQHIKETIDDLLSRREAPQS